MLDDAERANYEQAEALLVELFPPLWRQLYDGCVKQGFTEEQSLALLKAYILSQSSYGIHGT